MMRFFTSDLRRNITKIICLTAGMAIGFIVVAKIFIEVTYDSFYPDSDRIYLVYECVETNGEYREYPVTPGAIGPGLKRYVPAVEAATRYDEMTGHTTIRLTDGRSFEVDGVKMADSCFFDVVTRDISLGDPHEVLSVDGSCMIPASLARKIGNDPVGQTFVVPRLSDTYLFTIGGVYEDFPVNSTIDNSVFLSLASIGNFRYDGRENWMGNDHFITMAKLMPGTTPDETKPYIRRMLVDNIGEEDIDMYNFNMMLRPIADYHWSSGSVRTMSWVLTLLAVVMLMSSALNYLLVVVGQMGRRAKEMAIRKCFGTGRAAIFGRVMGESIFFLAVSIGLAVLLVLCFSDECGRLMGYTAEQLFTTSGVWAVEAGVCVVLLIVTGVVPAHMYCRTPVINAFRSNPRSRRRWKLGLLAVQFFASGMLVCLLALVMRQYRLMTEADLGFKPDNVAMLYTGGIDNQGRHALKAALEDMPGVASVASAYQDFTAGAAGNNVFDMENPVNQVNVADTYWSNPEIFDALGLEFVQGRGFSEQADSTTNQVVVEERFVDLLKNYFGETDDNIVGKTFVMSEHWDYENQSPLELTICGVVENMSRGGLTGSSADRRAAVMFPSSEMHRYIYVRFDHLDPQMMSEAQKTIDLTLPDKDLYLTPMKTKIDAQNAPVRNFGTSVMVVGLVILLIAVIGLTGYTADEVQRRAREIAIRKVNGTPVSAVLRLLCKDMLIVAIPSLILGGAAAILVGREWLSQFTDRVSLSPATMLVCLVAILVLLIAVVTSSSLRIARSNPVEWLRNE